MDRGAAAYNLIFLIKYVVTFYQILSDININMDRYFQNRQYFQFFKADKPSRKKLITV